MKDRDRSDCTPEPESTNNYREKFPDAYRTARRTGNCSEIPAKKVVFIEPNGQLAEPAYRQLNITPLIIRSVPKTSPCTGGRVGTAGSAAAGAVEGLVDWRFIPGIDRSRLLHISDTIAGPPTIPPETILAYTASQFKSVFLLTQAQADYMVAEIAAVTAAVNAAAQALADSLADCYFLNTEQIAECPPGALPGPNNPSIVPAGTVKSYISQLDADNIALEIAIANLVCLYGNPEVTKTCFEVFGTDNPPPTLTIPPGFGGLDQVGTVTVLAGTITATSVEEAEALAEALAISRLICIFYNVELTVTCEELGFEGVAEDGSTFTVPAKTFTSPDSQAAADALAREFGEAALDCKWVNELVSVACLLETELGAPLLDQTGNPYGVQVVDPGNTTSLVTVYPDKAASEDGGVYKVKIPVGSFTSYVSQEDANQQAEDYAASLLDCWYCNLGVGAFCTAGGSLDRTIGFPAGEFCGPDAVLVNKLAENLGSRAVRDVVSGGLTCRYGNDEITAGCLNPMADVSMFASGGAKLGPLGGVIYTPSLVYPELLGEGSIGLDPASYPVPGGAQPATITLVNISSEFEDNEFVTGADSGSTAIITSYTRDPVDPDTLVDPRTGVIAVIFPTASFSYNEVITGSKGGSARVGVYTPGLITFGGQITVPTNIFLASSLDIAGTPSEIKEELTNRAKELAYGALTCFFVNRPFLAEDPPRFPNAGPILCGGATVLSSAVLPFETEELWTAEQIRKFKEREGRDWDEGSDPPLPSLPESEGAWDAYWEADFLAEEGRAHDPETDPPLPGFDEKDVSEADKVVQGPLGSTANPVQLQAGLFRSELSLFDADQKAFNFGLSLLDCYYGNAGDPGKYYCEGEDPEADLAEGPVAEDSKGSRVNPVVVEPNIFFSYQSKAAANALEKSFALSQLNCYYENRPRVQEPSDYDDNLGPVLCDAAGGPGLDPAQVAPESRGSILNPVEVEPGIFTSTVSQEEADQLALSFGLTLLDCYFSNTELLYGCVSSGDVIGVADGTGFGAVASDRGPGFGDVPPITIPANTFTSRESLDELQLQLSLYASSLVQCFYANTSQTCPFSLCVGESSPGVPDEPVKVGEVDEGVFTSLGDRSLANNQASILACALTLCASDFIDIDIGGGGGGGGDFEFPDGMADFLIIHANGHQERVSLFTAFNSGTGILLPDGETYRDNWALEFDVKNYGLDPSPGSAFRDATEAVEPIANLTVARIIIRKDGEWVSTGGTYYEKLVYTGGFGFEVNLV